MRTVVSTILLTILAVELLLPLYSHHYRANAPVWRTYTILPIETTAGPSVVRGSARHAGNVIQAAPSALANKVLVLVSGRLGSNLFLASGLPMVLNLVCSDLYRPVHWIRQISSPPSLEIDLPPPDVPPRLVSSSVY